MLHVACIQGSPALKSNKIIGDQNGGRGVFLFFPNTR